MAHLLVTNDGDTRPCTDPDAADVRSTDISRLRGAFAHLGWTIVVPRRARQEALDVTEAEIRAKLERLDHLWDELFPTEQAPIVRLLVARVQISPTDADIQLLVDGLASLAYDLAGIGVDARRAA